MTAQSCGFKLHGHLSVEQELPKIKKAAGSAWTTLPACVGSIKPPEVPVGLCNALDLLGGRSPQSNTNEQITITGGIGHD